MAARTQDRGDRWLATAFLVVALLAAACSDPAIRLRADLAERLRALEDSGAQSASLLVGDDVDGPRWVVLFPPGESSVEDVGRLGVDPEIATRIFDRLEYVGVGAAGGPKVVVVPDRGRISFTSPPLLVVRQLSAGRCEPRCVFELKRVDGGWEGSIAGAGAEWATRLYFEPSDPDPGS